MTFNLEKKNRSFKGEWRRYRHNSHSCRSEMVFSVYLPDLCNDRLNLPGLFWLSGLTCSDQNFVEKSFAEATASELGIILIVPDTSPRGLDLPGDKDAYDFGEGAGFYVDATESPWSANYKMFSYVQNELYELALSRFPIDPHRVGVFGHSMGGHGALITALKAPDRFKTVSALSPICAPMHCPWGQKALQGYLGDDKRQWRQYDACALIADGARCDEILIDQGEDDEFLQQQLHPHLLAETAGDAGIKLTLRRHEGYDHSYFFIRSFIADHIRYHAERLAS